MDCTCLIRIQAFWVLLCRQSCELSRLFNQRHSIEVIPPEVFLRHPKPKKILRKDNILHSLFFFFEIKHYKYWTVGHQWSILTLWGPDGTASSWGAHLPPASPRRRDAFAQSRSETARQREGFVKNSFCPAVRWNHTTGLQFFIFILIWVFFLNHNDILLKFYDGTDSWES